MSSPEDSISRLYRVILNYGAFERMCLDNRNEVALDPLRPLLESGYGQVPNLRHWSLWLDWLQQPQAFRFMVLPTDGKLRPVLVGYTCLDAQYAPEIWDRLHADYAKMRAVLEPCGMWRPASKRPPRVPWTGVWLTNHSSSAGLDLAEILKFERLLGWAAIHYNDCVTRTGS